MRIDPRVAPSQKGKIALLETQPKEFVEVGFNR